MRRLAVVVGLVAIIANGCSGAAISGNESRAIGNVRMIMIAQATYSAMCGGSYAPTLPALLARGYLTGDLGTAEQPVSLGYRFRMTAVKGEGTTECGEGYYTEYEVRAEPEQPGATGTRYFRSSLDGDVYGATRADFSDAAPLR